MSKQIAKLSTRPAGEPTPIPITNFRNQLVAVEFNGVTALYSAMTPAERAMAEKELGKPRIIQRSTPRGMPVYVISPSKTQHTAPNPQKPSKSQRAADQAHMIKGLAALAADREPNIFERMIAAPW